MSYPVEVLVTAGVVLVAALVAASLSIYLRRLLREESAARRAALGRHPAQRGRHAKDRPLLRLVPAQRTNPDRRCPTCRATFEGCTCGSRTPREDTST